MTGIRENFLMCRLEIQSNYHLLKQNKLTKFIFKSQLPEKKPTRNADHISVSFCTSEDEIEYASIFSCLVSCHPSAPPACLSPHPWDSQN